MKKSMFYTLLAGFIVSAGTLVATPASAQLQVGDGNPGPGGRGDIDDYVTPTECPDGIGYDDGTDDGNFHTM